ncbi:MAG: hypothetical protein NZ988_04965 [Thaumarchaeota archaeon]|nr:hypothetical protein [Candidatus Calditenuaceae archaeon]MDW8187376.1 hypothetical protein [Nitrososphaerota archaeon]
MAALQNQLRKEEKVITRRSYAAGYRYCSRCRVYHLTDSVRCPYCGILLRNSPRKKKPVDPSRYVRIE